MINWQNRRLLAVSLLLEIPWGRMQRRMHRKWAFISVRVWNTKPWTASGQRPRNSKFAALPFICDAHRHTCTFTCFASVVSHGFSNKGDRSQSVKTAKTGTIPTKVVECQSLSKGLWELPSSSIFLPTIIPKIHRVAVLNLKVTFPSLKLTIYPRVSPLMLQMTCSSLVLTINYKSR